MGSIIKKVGVSANGLRSIMSKNSECISALDSYKSKKTLAMIIGIPGGFLTGYPLGFYLGSGGKWKDSFNVMLGIGIPLSIVSMIIEGSSTKFLKKAVSIHNSAILSYINGCNLSLKYNSNNNTMGINVLLSF